MQKSLVFKFLFLLSFLGLISSNEYIKMEYPLTLSNVEILYTSTYEIPMQTPMVDYKREFIILEKNRLTQTRIKDGLFGIYKDYNILFSEYQYNYEIKPLNYIIFEYFFSNKCDILIFHYYENEKFKWGHPRLKINCDQLKKNGKCKQNLEVSDPDYNLFAVYNVENNLISVIEYQIFQNEIKTIFTYSMEFNIVQALIYKYYYKSSDVGYLQYTLLIGIDESGSIDIWNIQGSYSFLDIISTNRLIKSFKFEKLYYQIKGARVAEIVKWHGFEKKLLYINNNNLILIDLYDLEIKVNQEVNFYGTYILMIKNEKQGLIGTKNGFIYLITVHETYISINDKYEICPGTKIKSISYNKTSPTDLEMTFLFIVNCGYYKIFQIKNRKNISDL